MQSLIEFFEKETNKKINMFKYNNEKITSNQNLIEFNNTTYVIEFLKDSILNHVNGHCYLFNQQNLDFDSLKNILNNLSIDDDTIKYIATMSGNDLRYAYNLLEVAYYSTADGVVNIDIIKSINNKPNIFHDKDGDGYYDLLSALQKSIRGSDVNASIYYMARLLEGGDLDSICRRLSVIVYEDIGLANPSMGPRVDAAINSALRLGFPEAGIPLAEIVIELALSPKSNSSYLALNSALNDIRLGNTGNVPNHIKTSSQLYKYPHNYKNSYVKQQYLPDNIKDRQYYIPKNNKNERMLKEVMDKLKEL